MDVKCHNGSHDQMESKQNAAVHKNSETTSIHLCVGGKAGHCTLCKKACSQLCQRCGDFYCSPDCQRNDWPTHRFICFQLPSLVNADQFNVGGVWERCDPMPGTCAASAWSKKNPLRPTNQVNTQAPPHAVANKQNSPKNQKSDKNTPHGKPVGRSNPKAPVRIPLLPLPLNKSHVVITGFRSTNRVNVRGNTPKEIEIYEATMNKISEYGQSAPPLAKVPSCRSYVITGFKGRMFRAQVVYVRGQSNIRLVLCDIGFIVIRNLNELFEINQEIILLPNATATLQLVGVPNNTLDETMKRFTMSREGFECIVKYGESDALGGNAMLYCVSTQTLLNKDLNEAMRDAATKTALIEPACSENESAKNDTKASIPSQQAKVPGDVAAGAEKGKPKESVPAQAPQTQVPMMHCPFEVHTLPENAVNTEVVVLDNSNLNCGYIGCIAEADFSYLINLQRRLDSLHLEDLPPYKPKLLEYCVAKFEESWYRARVVELPDDSSYTVAYVDFTNVHTVSSADIRRYPTDLKADCKTSLCLVDNLPPILEAKHIQFLQDELTPTSKITINVKGTIEDEVQPLVLVELNTIVKKMADQGLL